MAKKKSKSVKPLNKQRGLWSGTISFGLVNIGVRVISAKEKPDLSFSMIDPTNFAPVGYKYYNKSTGDELSRSSTVKGYEHKPGHYVVMTDADFKKANPKATQTIDIENFVRLDEIDPVFFDKAYYLVPTKGAEKAYQLLCTALAQSEKVAIAKMVMHTKQHLVALMPRGDFLLLEMLHFEEEVKELRELGEWKEAIPVKKAGAQEVKMAEKLIEDMTAKWEPLDYKNTYRDDLMKFINAKVKAGKSTEMTAEIEEKDTEKSAQVLDLMPLLKKSLASKKSLPKKRAPAKSKAR